MLIFNVLSGRLHKKARLEVLLDDAYWPAFSTIRPRSTHAQWEYIGEGVVKELDFSRVWLRLNEADEGEKDDVVAEWKGDAKAFLQQTMVRRTSSCIQCADADFARRTDPPSSPLWILMTRIRSLSSRSRRVISLSPSSLTLGKALTVRMLSQAWVWRGD